MEKELQIPNPFGIGIRNSGFLLGFGRKLRSDRILIFFQESTNTRKAGGLNFPAPMGGQRHEHARALIVAVVIRYK
jgi:hypothetical protein